MQCNTNLLLTEHEGRTGEYWPEVVAVRTERSEVRTKMTEGQYSPVRLELARLVSSLLYGTQAMLVLNLPAFETTETVRMAKSRPRKNQSERSDLPSHRVKYLLLTKREGSTGRSTTKKEPPDQERTNQSARICLAIE